MCELQFATIKGWSMAPILKEGDIVGYRQKGYKPGDIIIFKHGGLIVTHRLIETGKRLTAKGDNFTTLDVNIKPGNILGVAEYVLRNTTAKQIRLNVTKANKFLLNHARFEVRVISFTAKLMGEKFSGLVIKRMLLPVYVMRYFLFRIYAGTTGYF
ncbi:S26 family signal peptidase [Fulvivirgaceae bacterium BMA10]|uniref:S26 family signal peptidase n=1 Tax=Splendidivirga corallicola TaxID=3051826 RepID=A0ABT8KK80_9BACT|nr:S26 family signal peptidase [Fulvivirgaceae bacterium BMA10]